VNQDDGRIIVQVLCRLRSDIQFHGKVLFHTHGLGYHVDHSATWLQQLRLL
jgi:hypothetical protein